MPRGAWAEFELDVSVGVFARDISQAFRWNEKAFVEEVAVVALPYQDNEVGGRGCPQAGYKRGDSRGRVRGVYPYRLDL